MNADQAVLESIKLALRPTPGHVNYVEWAMECRAAVDELARIRKLMAEMLQIVLVAPDWFEHTCDWSLADKARATARDILSSIDGDSQ